MTEKRGLRQNLFRVTACVTAAVILSSCSGKTGENEPLTEAQEETEVSGTIEPGEYLGVYDEELAEEVILRTNEIRSKNNLDPFGTDEEMTEWARIRSAEIVFSFMHYRIDGSDMITAYRGASYTRYYSAIARGYRSAESMLDAWMSLDYQRDNILSNEFTHVGVACLIHNGVYYSVLVFLEP